MDQIENIGNTDYPEYPVLRLANPLPDHQYPNNDNDNMYFQHDNDNFETTTISNNKTTSNNMTTKNTTSNVTNLTGTLTNSHPLMYSPSSPDQEYPDLIPEKKSMKHSHKNSYGNKSSNTKFTFKPQAHSSVFNLHHVENPTNKLSYSTDIPNNGSSTMENIAGDFQRRIIKKSISSSDSSDSENDISSYKATLSPNLQNVSLTMNETQKSKEVEAPIYRRRRISLLPTMTAGEDSGDESDDISSIESIDSAKLKSQVIQDLLESSEDIIDPTQIVFKERNVECNSQQQEEIQEYSADEERRDSRHWQKIMLPNGEQHNIDMKVIEPYKRILSHGGYLKAGGHNAIVVFSACFLPDKSRSDYDYVMNNLFLYVLATLDQLVTEDYVLVYLHGGAAKSSRPSFTWIKKCYQLVDRKLRKNLKKLYIIHPTIWVRTLLLVCKPFISSKFYKKINYVNSLAELADDLPIEQAAIPDKVKNYEKAKFSC